MMQTKIDTSLTYAKQLDDKDPLQKYRMEYHFPKDANGEELIYMCGNSLGLQPKSTFQIVEREMARWKDLAVEGHFTGDSAWTKIHKKYAGMSAKIVGAKQEEVTLMNTLTVNLHLLLASFYKPDTKKKKILVEYSLFPSDRYALQSQIEWHGFNFEECLIEMRPSHGELISNDEIESYILKHKDELALILIGGVNYYTGQFYDLGYIAQLAQKNDITFGVDLAHAVGNVPLQLHDWGVDFAVWCTYKYLNGGPGSIGGAFVHQKHHASDLPKLKGWYGYEEKNRFLMTDYFQGEPDVNSWQLSNQPVLSLVPLEASLTLFEEIGMDALRNKSLQLTSYLSSLLATLDPTVLEQITPQNPDFRGCQLSIKLKKGDKNVFHQLRSAGILPDWRNPNVIRFSPTPMFNSFEDCWKVFDGLKKAISSL
jgi:kynureninase